MWRLSIAGISAALLGVAAYSLSPTPAYACSGDFSNFDPVAASEIIVEGRIVDAEVSPEQPGAYFDIWAEISVQRVWKGQAALEMFALPRLDTPSDPSTEPIGNLWVNGGGVCGAFGRSDPTGWYVVVGLKQDNDGAFWASRFELFYRGDDSGGERYDLALQRMASFPGAAALPALGSGLDASSPAAKLTVAAIMAITGAALLSLVVLSRISVRRSA